MRFYLTSLGCKLNQAEMESLGRQILAAGHELVADPAQADWAVVNTCTVTHVAVRKSRQAIGRLRRAGQGLRLAVLGCYGEMSPDEAAALPGVDLVLPNARKGLALQTIVEREPLVPPSTLPTTGRLPLGHTRAFLPIQEGCNNRCTYCIVHVARGPARSRPPADVLAEAQTRLDEGYRELVLTGTHIGAYGCDLGDWPLTRLTRELLALPGLGRVRLSSLEPWDVTPELLALWPHPRLCRHLYLPIQSGSDAILQRMGRAYDAAHVRALAAAARARAPEMGLATDVIVGFPGETEADFAATLDLVAACQFARVHVFPFSPRQGTPAAEMPDRVNVQTVRERARRLTRLVAEQARAFHQHLVGQTVEVLFETSTSGEGVPVWEGLSDHYVRVCVAADARDLHNVLAPVRIRSADAEGAQGELT